MMITKEQITDWFCERNHISKEKLDKYHRYAIATALKYEQELVVSNRKEQLKAFLDYLDSRYSEKGTRDKIVDEFLSI